MKRTSPLSHALVPVALLVAYACGGSTNDNRFDDPSLDGGASSSSSSGFIPDGGEGGKPVGCKGLECQITACGNGTKTTISGTVYAPTPAQFGNPDPIYNAILYVPNAELQPFPKTVSCDKCGTITSGSPIATALSGADGKFTIENVPDGADIPIVIQVGRWRRLVKIPKVEACKDNPLDKEQTRLPRNKSEGDIPLMAIATSQFDPTECILRKIGIDVEEFTVPTKDGRVHLYKGSGATLEGDTPPPASALWASPENLKRYDIVALPCQTVASYKPSGTGVTSVGTYADEGGRVFITDLSKDVIQNGPTTWRNTGTFGGASFTNPGVIDTTFPKGQALADWLFAIGATPQKGQIKLDAVVTSLSAVMPPSQRWVSGTGSGVMGGGIETYSFNTPVPAAPADQCGRVVYSGFHIAQSGGTSFPTECMSTPLTPQEKTLEFLLFDLAACIQKDDTPPAPPPVVK